MNHQERQIPVALVTGSSTGIGLATSLALAKQNFRTYATMRNLNKSAGITSKAAKENLQLSVLEMDVDDDKSVKETIDKIIDDNGRIDVVVNNAGYALVGALKKQICRMAEHKWKQTSLVL